MATPNVPYTFATQSGNIPLNQLDANFADVKEYVLTAGVVVEPSQPAITSLGLLNSLETSGNIRSRFGNVSAQYFLGDGSLLTGLPPAYGNANVASFLAVYGGPITAGTVTASSVMSAPLVTGAFSGNAIGLFSVPAGNLSGAVAFANSALTAITATTATSATTATTATTAGTVTAAAQPNITSVGTLGSLTVSGVSTLGTVDASTVNATNGVFSTVSGNANASSLTSGTVPVARLSGTYNIAISGSAACAAAATTAITVTNSNQPNITSVGTLSSLTVSGGITSGSLSSTTVVATGAVTAASGSVSGNLVVGNANASGNIQANFFIGNGSLLTGISGGGGGGVGPRSTANISTGSIANAATANTTVTLAKGYSLYKVETSAAAWVRLYGNAAQRTADASRSQFTDPQPSSGVMAEVITASANTVIISPAAFGWNDDTPVSSSIPIAVTNLSGGTANITVTFTYLPVET